MSRQFHMQTMIQVQPVTVLAGAQSRRRGRKYVLLKPTGILIFSTWQICSCTGTAGRAQLQHDESMIRLIKYSDDSILQRRPVTHSTTQQSWLIQFLNRVPTVPLSKLFMNMSRC